MNKTKRADIYSIDPRNIIVTEGFNSRINFGDIDELAAQIKECGLLNPITVQAVKTEDGDKYKLVDGERRYRAIMKLIDEGFDIPYVKAMMLPATMTTVDLYVQQAIRNEGKNFNEYEWAILAQKMMKDGNINANECARRLGKTASHVSYWLQILEWPEDFQELVRTGKLCGADVRRILQANKTADKKAVDFESARKDVQQLEDKAKAREEAKQPVEEKSEQTEDKVQKKEPEVHKLTLRDLDFSSNTKAFKDSKTILNALKCIRSYSNDITGNEDLQLDMNTLFVQLNEEMLITDAIRQQLKDHKAKAKNEAV